MKRCPICSSTFAADDQFCPNDGSVLIDGTSSADTPTVVLHTPQPRPAYYSDGPSAQRSSSRWMIPAIGILCGLVVVLGFLAFYKTTPVDSDKKNSHGSEKAAAAASTSPTPLPTIPPQVVGTTRVVQVNSPGDRFLALRTEPSAEFGLKIVEIPHGERITLGTCEQNFVVISGKKGRWCQTSYGGRSGWIFDAFVRY